MLDLFQADWRDLWAGSVDSEPVGVVYTKAEIVELILDLVGYSGVGGRLSSRTLLEPSCGDGAFLRCAIERLIASENAHSPRGIDWSTQSLDLCVRACDIAASSVDSARALVGQLLESAGCPPKRASELGETWVVQCDFLLADWGRKFDFVVGNPPYVRIEDLPKAVLTRYRSMFSTLTDRADIYIAFFERGLELLSESGALSFICANRFTKNKYGEPLRRLIASQNRVRYFLNLEHTNPFESEVSAYPAVVVIDRRQGEPTRARTLDVLDDESLSSLRPRHEHYDSAWSLFDTWYGGGAAWTSTDAHESLRLTNLADRFSTIEDSGSGTRIGIGVATGADKTFILEGKSAEIEDSVQLPLLLASDVGNEGLEWSGHYLLNPFALSDDGSLIDLAAYPGVARHFDLHGEQLRRRHVARSRPHLWYRTIDRVWPALVRKPKLVIPDIQMRTTIGFDPGRFYPHHNLYWITSDSWNLRALQALLRSEHVIAQVRAYSVQMRGGALRFQAQTLRKVRIPALSTLSPSTIARLAAAADSPDQGLLDALASEAFGPRFTPERVVADVA